MSSNTKWILIVVLLTAVSMALFYPGMVARVIDAETAKPIKGAVITAEWIERKGIGLTHTESYKVMEVETGENGTVWIPGVYAFVDLGSLAVYKKGYVAWSKDYIFPDYKKRTNFMWCCFYKVFRLERYKPEYSYINHTSFISRSIRSELSEKKVIEKAYRWEELKASEERNLIMEQRRLKNE